MRPRIERALKAIVLVGLLGLVGLTFYIAGPAMGLAFAGIAAVLLIFSRHGATASQEDVLSSMTNNPAFSNWEGNIFHKKSSSAHSEE